MRPMTQRNLSGKVNASKFYDNMGKSLSEVESKYLHSVTEAMPQFMDCSVHK